MDSLLSNSQRCARKADSLIVCGLYDQALGQLDKACELLFQLKAASTRLDTNQFLNEQIEAVDRKKRLVAIKRAESIRKKSQLEALISKSKELQSRDQAVMIQHTHQQQHTSQAKFRHGSKLSKDDKCVLEELSTSNAEFKKVNTYLANEIEELKRENEFLKVELIRAKLSDDNDDNNSEIANTHHHQPLRQQVIQQAATVNNSLPHEIQSLNQGNSGDDDDDDEDDIAIVDSPKDTSQTTTMLEIRIAAAHNTTTSPTTSNSSSSGSSSNTTSSSHSSSSMTASSSQTSSSSTNSSSLNDISATDQKIQNIVTTTRGRGELLLPVQQLVVSSSSHQFVMNKRVDLSQYINEEDDDDDEDDVEVSHNLDDSDHGGVLGVGGGGGGSGGAPPNEFTID